MMIRKLTDHEYAQCHTEIAENGDTYFFSYQTMVAEIRVDEITGWRWLYVHGLYSATTRKQLGWFMREYCDMDYHTAKLIYEDNEWICLDTGEVVSNS